MKKSILSVAILGLAIASCQNRVEPAAQAVRAAQDSVLDHDEHHSSQASPVSLNQGKKWVANAETKEGINKMAALLDAFPNPPQPDDFLTLKVNLETEFNQVIQQCTMTGEAHEQLHNYLMPMAEMISQLNPKDVNHSGSVKEKLKQHLDEFGNYFE